ncbi:MAG: sulfite exporter TauE/SafE family protein [Bdellovibrionales bacterium]
MEYGLPVSLFLAGLVGGATHCSLMCAPFVLAQTKDNIDLKRPAPYLLLPYHLGRMTTYVMLAVLVSSVLNLAFIASDLRAMISAPLLVLAGIIFLVSAFPALASLFPWAANIRITAPYALISRYTKKLMHGGGVLKRYLLGILLGFMPCGLVVSALLAAASAPNPAYAAAAMAAFTIGTMPSLLLVAVGGHALQQKYPLAAKHMSRGAMAVSSLWLFFLAGTLVF